MDTKDVTITKSGIELSLKLNVSVLMKIHNQAKPWPSFFIHFFSCECLILLFSVPTNFIFWCCFWEQNFWNAQDIFEDVYKPWLAILAKYGLHFFLPRQFLCEKFKALRELSSYRSFLLMRTKRQKYWISWATSFFKKGETSSLFETFLFKMIRLKPYRQV